MKKRPRSVWFWLITVVTVWLLLTASVSALLIRSANAKIREQAYSERESYLGFYVSQTEAGLRTAYATLVDLLGTNEDVLNLLLKESHIDNAFSKSRISKELSSKAIRQKSVSGFFFYAPEMKNGESFFTYATNESKYDFVAAPRSISSSVLSSYVADNLKNDALPLSTWYVTSFNDKNYLFFILSERNAYAGCYFNLNDLLSPLPDADSKTSFLMFTDSAGNVLTDSASGLTSIELISKTGEQNNIERLNGTPYMEIDSPSVLADISLVNLIPLDTLTKAYMPFQRILFLCIFSGVIFFLIFVGLLWRAYYRPVKHLLNVIEKVRQGDTASRVTRFSGIRELNTLNQAFNEMMDETEDLKISIYEQKLKERETYLNYLQIQIQPHFFLNSLNLVYSLAQLKKYEDIQQLSLNLVKYFRFMFRKATSLITIREEIEHVRNYMSIQHIRFPEGLHGEDRVADDLWDALIPPLAIQTFVENSIKYALDPKKGTEILITVEHLNENMKVTIRDNGRGFALDTLLILNSDQHFEGDGTHRIGIQNIKERLQMIFGEENYIHFYNDHGGVAEYIIPIRRNENVPDTVG